MFNSGKVIAFSVAGLVIVIIVLVVIVVAVGQNSASANTNNVLAQATVSSTPTAALPGSTTPTTPVAGRGTGRTPVARRAGTPSARGATGAEGNVGAGAEGLALAKNSLTATASTLGITPEALISDLKSGQTISDIATAKNVDLPTVKTAMLASIKSDLDAAVASGTITQTQADTRYQVATKDIDKLVTTDLSSRLNNLGNNGTNGGGRLRGGIQNTTATPDATE